MNPLCSLQQSKIIITVASWEDRFLLGIEQLIGKSSPAKILMFHYKEYADWSKENRDKIARICTEKNIDLINDKELAFGSPLESWINLVSEVENAINPGELITLDISTMPRETIWAICHVLAKRNISIQYTYHKPQSTNGYADWLSRDPGKPRILYKQAGIQHLGRPTLLVIQTGYDVERAKQLERFFEPDKVFLGLQTGEQFANSEQNRQKHEIAFSSRKDIELFDIDGYSLDGVYDAIADKISTCLDDYNIVLSSLGPKIGALALFRIKQAFSNVALCYAPSNEFNREYSKGIGDCIHGVIEAKAPLEQEVVT